MANKKGGRQAGAGRPKGSLSKPRLSDFVTKEEIATLVAKAVEMASTGDSTMLKFVLEQEFGKAIQPVEGDFKGEVRITFGEAFKQNESSY